MPRVRAVERLVADREVGDDVALDCGFQKRPLEPRRVAQVAALYTALAVEPQPDEDVATEGFGETEALATLALGRNGALNLAAWQAPKNLLDQRQALIEQILG